MKEERFPHPGKPLHLPGDKLGQKGSFRGWEESAAPSLRWAEQRETCTEGLGHHSAVPSPRLSSAGVHRGWVVKLGLQRTDQGLATRRQPEGTGEWSKAQLGVCTGTSPHLPLKPCH